VEAMKQKQANILAMAKVPCDHFSERQHLINWSNLVNITNMNDHELVTILQDIYAHTSVKDMESFIKEIHDNNKNELKHVIFTIGKMMGTETSYEVIRIIGIKIANDEIEKNIDERTKDVSKMEDEFHKKQSDFNARVRENEKIISDLKSDLNKTQEKNIFLVDENKNLQTYIKNLEDECNDLKTNAEYFLLLKQMFKNLSS
jgi:hypothetical protein